jgi:hypothetical protein
MNRREFLRNSVYIPALGITLVYSLSGCSSDDSTTSSTCTTVSSVSAAIGSNHGHTITAPTVDEVNAGVEITLDLTTGNGHTHTVTLSAADLESLSTCGTEINSSTTDSDHPHSVTFTGSA